jgi:hypothetical protein
MREQIFLETLHQFSGKYPPVPMAPGVDLTQFTEGDENSEGDKKPFFVTLPIGKVGARSRNKRNYPREAIQEIVRQIDTNQPSGNLGHPKNGAESGNGFNLPAIYWVGAILEESTGVAWGKFYVPMYRQDLREYYRLAMRRGANVATSLLGTTEIDANGNVINPQITWIDVVNPHEAGVLEAVGKPQITMESTNDPLKEEDMGNEYGDLIAERDTFKRQLTEAQTEVATLKTNAQTAAQTLTSLSEIAGSANVGETLKTLQAFQEQVIEALKSDKPLEAIQALKTERDGLAEAVGSIDAVKAMRGTFAEIETLVGDKPVEAIQKLQSDLTAARTELGEMLKETVKLSVDTEVKVPSARPMVLKLLEAKQPQNREQVKTMLSEILDSEEVKALLVDQVKKTMGGAQRGAVVPPPPDQKGKYFTIPKRED